MSRIYKISMTDLHGTVSFGGGGGGGGDGSSRDRERTYVKNGAAAFTCAASTYLAYNIPAITPQTVAAKIVATGLSIVSCGIATTPIANRFHNGR